jgi:excisionase family DNA binding protein
MSIDPLLRADVAAKRLGVNLETLYRWMRCGHIAFVQPGRRRKLVRESEVNRLLVERLARPRNISPT